MGSGTAEGGEGSTAHQADPTAQEAAANALFQATSHVAWLIGGDGTIRWVSRAVEPMLGHQPATLVGTNVLDLLHPEDRTLAHSLLEFGAANPGEGRAERNHGNFPIDLRVRHRDGRWTTMELLITNFLASPGINAILLMGREVTSRRALDDALALLAHAPDDDQAILGLLGFVEARLADTAAALYWPGDTRPWRTEHVPAELLATSGPWERSVATKEYVIVPDLTDPVAGGDLPGGALAAARRHGFVACWCVPVPAAPSEGAGYSYSRGVPAVDRKPVASLVVWSSRHAEPLKGYWGVLERASGLLHLALARRILDTEREQRLTREREQVRRLQELDTMKTDLVLSVSHELRTPLTSIISFADLLAKYPGTHTQEEEAEFLEIIRRNADRLLRMVEDLLFLGRLESHLVQLARAPVDMAALVATAVEAAGPAAAKAGVQLTHRVVPGPPLVGDADRLHQLLGNLLANAIKYTPEGGRVSVEAEPSRGGWRLGVSDNGIGIPPEERGQVFDRFFRGSNVRRAQIAGNGLGLAIAQAVADMHHGGITVEETPGGGATFQVTLRDS